MFQVSDTLKAVRFYEASDPYFWTVDNRPHADTDENTSKLADAIDGGYMSTMLTQSLVAQLVSLSAVDPGDVYIGDSLNINGLNVTLPEGMLLYPDSYSADDNRDTRKLAVAYEPFFTQVQPGNSYLIQARPVSLETTHETVPYIQQEPEYGKYATTVALLEYTVKQADYTEDEITPDSGFISLVRLDVPSSASTVPSNGVTYQESYRFARDFGNRQEEHLEIRASDNNMELDLSAARYFDVTVTSSCEIDPQNVPSYGITDITLCLTQDSTGGRVVAFPEGSVFVSGSEDMISREANAETWVRMISMSGGPWRVFAL